MKKAVANEFSNLTGMEERAKLSRVFKILLKILKPERKFYITTIIYGLSISFLTLAAPISVQALITTVANTTLVNQIFVLSGILFGLLCLSGALNALRTYVMELFQRHFYARVTSEIVLQKIYVKHAYFKTINRTELVNRYFDIMTVQKNVPSLLTGGFALVLQSIVGLVLVSFYHPALLAFNIIFILAVFLIWRIWWHKAVLSGLCLSNAKYEMAHWLEDLANSNDDFKQKKHVEYALRRSEDLLRHYIEERQDHFRYKFSQVIGFLFVYAFFSAALLGLGGWLVVQSQLTLGQLVASELILSAIFFGISRAGTYLSLIYELIPAVEKISYFYKLPTEAEGGREFEMEEPFSIRFENVRYAYRDMFLEFNLEIPARSKNLVSVSSQVLQETLIDLLMEYRTPDAGTVTLDGQDIREFDPHSYRDHIAVLDNPFVIEGTIKQFLKITDPDVSLTRINEVLKLVALDDVIDDLPNGLETEIISTGYPLSSSETLRLKLASALLHKPKVMILTEHFDIVGYQIRQSILNKLCQIEDLTLIYFTNRRDVPVFDTYLYINHKSHTYLNTLPEFQAFDFIPVSSQDQPSGDRS